MLSEIEPGDEVGVFEEQFGKSRIDHLARVARVTATQIVLDDGSRWRRRDGFRVGDRRVWGRRFRVGDRRVWGRRYIRYATDSLRYAEEHERLLRRIKDCFGGGGWRTAGLRIDTLRTIAAALDSDPAVAK